MIKFNEAPARDLRLSCIGAYIPVFCSAFISSSLNKFYPLFSIELS